MENVNKNKGITLIELIVVIAIMMVLTAAVGLSFSLVGRQKVSNAAASFKQTFQLGQTYAKSKGACKMTIKATSENGSNTFIYTAASTEDFKEPIDPKKVKLGNGPNNINEKIKIEVCFSKSGWKKLGKDITSFDIVFNRKTGGVIEVPGTKDGVPTQIKFTNGDKTVTLNIATYTGVITYDN